MRSPTEPTAALLEALLFASAMHKSQTRKGVDGEPYVNHVIQVAELLARVGGIVDVEVLQAAILHDTVEDTIATFDDIEKRFGPNVRQIVEEVSDDDSLPKKDRKELQVERAPQLSAAARSIKIADKTCNVRDVTRSPPADWEEERQVGYLDWADRVIAGCRGVNLQLERHYDAVVAECRALLARGGGRSKPK